MSLSRVIDPSWIVEETKDICCICHGIYRDPVQTNNADIDSTNAEEKEACGHIFCEECIKQWLVQHDSCPICRREIDDDDDDLTKDIAKRREIDNLTAKCHIHPACPARGQVNRGKFWDEHEKVCLYKQITCVLCQHFTVERKFMSDHTFQCEEAYTYCKAQCGEFIKAKTFSQHGQVCQMRSVKCYQCNESYPISSGFQHANNCKFLQDVSGTGISLNAIQFHIELMTKRIITLETRLSRLECPKTNQFKRKRVDMRVFDLPKSTSDSQSSQQNTNTTQKKKKQNESESILEYNRDFDKNDDCSPDHIVLCWSFQWKENEEPFACPLRSDLLVPHLNTFQTEGKTISKEKWLFILSNEKHPEKENGDDIRIFLSKAIVTDDNKKEGKDNEKNLWVYKIILLDPRDAQVILESRNKFPLLGNDTDTLETPLFSKRVLEKKGVLNKFSGLTTILVRAIVQSI